MKDIILLITVLIVGIILCIAHFITSKKQHKEVASYNILLMLFFPFAIYSALKMMYLIVITPVGNLGVFASYQSELLLSSFALLILSITYIINSFK